jgi:hypothetical protein
MTAGNRSWWRGTFVALAFSTALSAQCADSGGDSRGPAGQDQTALEMGSSVRLRVTESVPASARAGDPVKLEVLEEVRVKGHLVVILRGAEAGATVAPGTRRRIVPWRRGGWTLQIGSVRDVTGRAIPLRAFADVEIGDYLTDASILPKGTVIATVVASTVCFDTNLLKKLRFERKSREMQARAAAGTALLHVYRKSKMVLSVAEARIPQERRISIELDGRELVRLEENRVVAIPLAPGMHTMRSRGFETTLLVESGQELFIRANERPFKDHVDMVDDETGEDEAASLMSVAPSGRWSR